MVGAGDDAERSDEEERRRCETAYGLTVPPPVIAENRAELMILIATNLLGQNTPAIAVNEAEYGEMWA